MKFLADECVDAGLIDMLRTAGHDVLCVQERSVGLDDVAVLSLAAEEDRVLLTEDKDFGELAFRRRNVVVPGIVLMRIDPAARDLKQSRLAAAIDRFGERLTGHFTVIHETRYRTRRLP